MKIVTLSTYTTKRETRAPCACRRIVHCESVTFCSVISRPPIQSRVFLLNCYLLPALIAGLSQFMQYNPKLVFVPLFTRPNSNLVNRQTLTRTYALQSHSHPLHVQCARYDSPMTALHRSHVTRHTSHATRHTPPGMGVLAGTDAGALVLFAESSVSGTGHLHISIRTCPSTLILVPSLHALNFRTIDPLCQQRYGIFASALCRLTSSDPSSFSRQMYLAGFVSTISHCSLHVRGACNRDRVANRRRL